MAEHGHIDQPQQAVRFNSVDEEIRSHGGLQNVEEVTAPDHAPVEEFSPDAQEELRILSVSLRQSRLQSKRMEKFAFEPVSLPVSRVPSSASGSRPSSRQHTDFLSPRPSPPQHNLQSPPLTPSDSAREGSSSPALPPSTGKGVPHATLITPQASSPHESPSSINEMAKHREEGRPPAQDTSPDESQSAALPSTGGQGATAPGSRPFTPVGDRDDPYARSKRRPQPTNINSIDPRFVFEAIDSRKRSGHSSPKFPRATGSSPELRPSDDRRHSSLFGKKHEHTDNSTSGGKSHGSMSDLKRFFKLGGSRIKDKRGKIPASTGTTISPHKAVQGQSTFSESDGLEMKYGKLGKVLGKGAGGSVRIVKRGDGITFAAKEFQPRHVHESEREYKKKVTAEYCIGSMLHHGNIIETMDIVYVNGKWWEVMEYAPYDLFAIVMTGKMSKEEVHCCFLQILRGVEHMHSLGIAHRDLKLDNVVVSREGIMKIIDFGSASVFKYPLEKELILASGVVGSDPYLAPEVFELTTYDPRPVDIWSLAIIFCCMTLRRFPWKMAQLSDNSYKLFVSTPNTERPKRVMEHANRSTGDLHDSVKEDRRRLGPSEPVTREPSNSETPTSHHHGHHHHGESNRVPSTPDTEKSEGVSQQPIKGPWRLLRLLPRETRHIIGRMLEVDPNKRATMEEILADKWIASCAVCWAEGEHVVHAPGHEHTLVVGTAPTTS